MTPNRKATPFRGYWWVLVFFNNANHPNIMLNEPYCHTSLAEPMSLVIYTISPEVSSIKTNNAFFSDKVIQVFNHLTRPRVASNRIRKYARKQTRQTRIEFTFRESPLSAHCPTTGKSATHEFFWYVLFFAWFIDIISVEVAVSLSLSWSFHEKLFVHIHIPRKNISGRKRKKTKQNNLIVDPLYLIIDSSESFFFS